MADPQGLAFFPGIQQIVGAEYSLGHGITPGVCSMQIAPQSSLIAEGGTLEFTFDSVLLQFRGCKVDQGTLLRNSQNQIVNLSILDRRWRWAFGSISGAYNLRIENGELINNDGTGTAGLVEITEEDPQQLATLCLEAMGETGFDVSSLPNLARPLVQWEYDNPAQALASLCEELGCRGVLGLDNRVRIQRVGVGSALPLSPDIRDDSASIDPPERPDKISVVAGRTRYQVDFELEAVGVEKDDIIKLVDDLSYKPTAGWSKSDLPHFMSVSDTKLRELAKKCVFRWYRVKVPVSIPGFGKNNDQVKSLTQLLLEDEQVATRVEDGLTKNKPAQVHGIFQITDDYKNKGDPNADGTGPLTPTPDDDAIWRGGFSIDSDTGIVKFGERLLRNAGTSTLPVWGPAKLILRAACSVRDETTRSWQHYEDTRNYGNAFGTRARIIKRDEIHLAFTPIYAAGTGYPTAVSVLDDNKATIDPELQHYLNAAEQEYQVTNPQSRTYAGLKAISPDGAIQQVTWSVGGAGATTRASRNNDTDYKSPSYRERRLVEKTRQLQTERVDKVLRQLNEFFQRPKESQRVIL